MKRLLVTTAILFLAGNFGCDFVKEETQERTEVTHEVEIPVSFTINGNKICEETENKFDCENQERTSATEDAELGTVEWDQDVDVTEHAEEPGKLREVSGRFNKITISKIEYEYADNDLSFGTPPLELYVSAKEATKDNYTTEFSDQTVHLTTLPRVEPGVDESGTAEVSEEAEQEASPLFQDLKFSEISKGEFTIRADEDEVPPGGTSDVDLTMFVKLSADAVSAVEN